MSDYQDAMDLRAQGHSFKALVMAAMSIARQDPEAVYLRRLQGAFPMIWADLASEIDGSRNRQAGGYADDR